MYFTGYRVDRGGVIVAIRNLATSARFGVVLGVGPGFRREGTPAEIEAMELPLLTPEAIGLANFFRARRVARTVWTWLRNDRTRIFHGQSRAGLLVALWLLWWGERHVVVSVHCYGRQRWFYRAAKRMLGSRLRWLSPAMVRYYYGITAAGWTDCVPVALPGPPNVAPMRHFPGGRALRVGGAGQLTSNKRWDVVLAALAALPREAAVEFHHIGAELEDADSRRCALALRERAAREDLAGRVHWHGWQPDSTGLLSNVDVVVVPFEHESFSLIALEALLAGVPVIAMRGGGPEDFIVDGVNGWLLPAGEPRALGRLLQQLLERAAWREIRQAPELLGRFAPSRVAEEWAGVYASL